MQEQIGVAVACACESTGHFLECDAADEGGGDAGFFGDQRAVLRVSSVAHSGIFERGIVEDVELKSFRCGKSDVNQKGVARWIGGVRFSDCESGGGVAAGLAVDQGIVAYAFDGMLHVFGFEPDGFAVADGELEARTSAVSRRG